MPTMQASTRPVTDSLKDQLTMGLPLLGLSLFFLIGILIASWLRLPAYGWLVLVAAAVLLLILLRRFFPASALPRIPVTLLGLFLLALLLGAARYQLARPEPDPFDVAFYKDRQYDVLVTGWVAENPDRRDTYTNLRVQVEAVDTGSGDLRAGGLILARVDDNQVFHYGQRLRFRGRLETPPSGEEFSYRDYLARRGIRVYMPFAEATLLPGRGGNPFSAALFSIKEYSLARVYRLFPDPEASLLAGILLGVDTGLTRGLQNAFRRTGTSHIIAISGFNISVIAGFVFLSLNRLLNPRHVRLIAILVVLGYVLLVGAEPSVLRAAIMSIIAFLAWQVGRRNLALNGLALAALLMLAINPLYVWDVGFQLSFLATLGLVLYADPLTSLAGRGLAALRAPADVIAQVLPLIANFFLLTLAAQIAVIPIIAYHFKTISLVSLVANPFILPAQPAIMIVGGAALLISLFILPLGQLVAWLAWPFVEYTIRTVELFDRLPGGTLYLGNTSPWLVTAFYVLLFGGTLAYPGFKDRLASLWTRLRNVGLIALLVACFALTLIVWRSAAALPDGDLHITFLSVGSADAVLVQSPSGRSVLVNGGPSISELSDDLGRRLPILRRRLDWLVIASPLENQVASLPRLIERYPPQYVLWSGNVDASYSSRQVDVILAEAGIPVLRAEEGQRLNLGEGAYIEVVAAGPRGSVLLVGWRDFRALLPVGMDLDMLEELEYGNKIGPVDVLLLADSGYFATNTVDWVDNLHPQLAVLSVAAGDPDGLPDPEVLDAVAGYPLLRTDRNGWIKVSSDGTEMRVEAERR